MPGGELTAQLWSSKISSPAIASMIKIRPSLLVLEALCSLKSRLNSQQSH